MFGDCTTNLIKCKCARKIALNKYLSALLLASLTLVGTAYSTRTAYAHSFTGDQSAAFLTLVEATKVQLQLVQSDFSSDMEEAGEHAEHATESIDDEVIKEISEKNERLGRDLPAALEDLNGSLTNSSRTEIDGKVQNINNLLAETVTVRVEQRQLGNSTVQALVLVNMGDEVLGHYGEAYGIEEQDNDTSMDVNMTGTDNAANASDTIIDLVQYHSAQGMVAKLEQYYNDEVKAIAPSNATQPLAAFEAGVQKLKQAIDEKKPFNDVQVIVHTDVQPNLQKAYNLQIIPEFPLPLVMMIPAIAGIIVATRVRGLRK